MLTNNRLSFLFFCKMYVKYYVAYMEAFKYSVTDLQFLIFIKFVNIFIVILKDFSNFSINT